MSQIFSYKWYKHLKVVCSYINSLGTWLSPEQRQPHLLPLGALWHLGSPHCRWDPAPQMGRKVWLLFADKIAEDKDVLWFPALSRPAFEGPCWTYLMKERGLRKKECFLLFQNRVVLWEFAEGPGDSASLPFFIWRNQAHTGTCKTSCWERLLSLPMSQARINVIQSVLAGLLGHQLCQERQERFTSFRWGETQRWHPQCQEEEVRSSS